LGNGRVGWRAGTPSHPFHPVSHRPFGSHLGTLDSLHARWSELPSRDELSVFGTRDPVRVEDRSGPAIETWWSWM